MTETLGDALRERPFNLALSSGFFGFYAHAGFLSAFEDAQLTPQLITGSSAGALAGGLWGAGVSTTTLSHVLLQLTREDFWDPAPGFGLLRGKLFRERLDVLLPTVSFEGARIPLAISVFDVWKRATTVRRSGSLAAALHASCALPGLFHPVWIDGRPHLDGGIADRPGWQGQNEQFTVQHHLASRAKRPLERRTNTTVVSLRGLPMVTPFALTRGHHAFHSAREATRRALVAPLADVITV